MDELVIEDKKYISSKRAADVTGYAKDYVGQLAREGYVAARRVGRNWYVLESAIKDHRFGTTVPQEPQSTPEDKKEPQSVTDTWQAPRYVPIEAEHLPSINRLHNDTEPVTGHTEAIEEATGEGSQPHGDFQDTWQAWFDTFRRPSQVVHHETVEPEAPLPDTGEYREDPDEIAVEWPVELSDKTYEAEQEDDVPIHVLPDTRRGDTVEPPTYAPRLSLERPSPKKGRAQPPVKGQRAITLIIRVVSMLVALVFVVATVLGSGYFDTSTFSYKQAAVLSGISVYNK